MSFNRVMLTIFALSDALLLGRFLRTVHIPDLALDPLWALTLEADWSLFVLSLAVSAFGLAMERKWGMLLSYVQFPFRLAFMLLSFLIEFPVPSLQTPVMIVAMILELCRLVVTIVIHVRYCRARLSAPFPVILTEVK